MDTFDPAFARSLVMEQLEEDTGVAVAFIAAQNPEVELWSRVRAGAPPAFFTLWAGDTLNAQLATADCYRDAASLGALIGRTLTGPAGRPYGIGIRTAHIVTALNSERWEPLLDFTSSIGRLGSFLSPLDTEPDESAFLLLGRCELAEALNLRAGRQVFTPLSSFEGESGFLSGMAQGGPCRTYFSKEATPGGQAFLARLTGDKELSMLFYGIPDTHYLESGGGLIPQQWAVDLFIEDPYAFRLSTGIGQLPFFGGIQSPYNESRFAAAALPLVTEESTAPIPSALERFAAASLREQLENILMATLCEPNRISKAEALQKIAELKAGREYELVSKSASEAGI